MIISPEAQKALLDLVLNATNSTASQSASQRSTPDDNNPSSGFSSSGNEIYYAIGALALAMTAGVVYFVKTMNRQERRIPVIYSSQGMPNNNNLGGNASAMDINNSDNNNNNNNNNLR